MGNAALSPAPAEAATAAWRAPPAKDKGPRRPPRAPRPSEPKAVREAIPLPADVLPHLFSYSCAREVGTFRFLVSRGASAQLIATAELAPTLADAERGAGKESEIPNFKGSDLGHFPLVSADFWTSDHLSERPRSVDAFSGTHARGTLTLKRR